MNIRFSEAFTVISFASSPLAFIMQEQNKIKYKIFSSSDNMCCVLCQKKESTLDGESDETKEVKRDSSGLDAGLMC